MGGQKTFWCELRINGDDEEKSAKRPPIYLCPFSPLLVQLFWTSSSFVLRPSLAVRSLPPRSFGYPRPSAFVGCFAACLHSVPALPFALAELLLAAFDLETRQYDAVNAFANSPIGEPTYCQLPEGWPRSEKVNILLLLLRALYGLKQSPALWYQNLSKVLIEMNLELVPGVDCVFISQDTHILLFFFVDDIVILYDRRYINQVDQFQALLFQKYEMRYLGQLEWFLGIHIIRDRNIRQLWLYQDSYIDKLIAKFNINLDLTKRSTQSPLPLEELTKNNSMATAQEIHSYQQRVGSLNFAAVITRPDVAQAASKLSELLTNPSKHHMDCVNRTLKYLAHTKHLAILFNTQATYSREIFLASSDASFADDSSTRYSSQGYAFKLFNGMIDWKASKQCTVTTSSTEAELLAISAAGKELI